MAYSTITKPSSYFISLLHTGNGSSPRAITGVGFQPDWVWTKNRSGANSNTLGDVVRGTGKTLLSDSNSAEYTNNTYGYHSAFASDGFSLTGSQASAGGDNVNKNSNDYVNFCWKAGGTGSANSDGSVASTVSANTTAGFSIVKYTGNATNSTVGHGLGVTPQVLIVKNLDSTSSGAEHWRVQHHKVSASKVLHLNLTNAEDTNNDFQSTYPGSSTFSISSADGCNKNGEENIAYCFAEKTGYSKFGKYTGNGNANGPFIYTGFKPAWILTKRTDSTGNWHIFDNKRPTENPTDKVINTNTNAAESDEGQGFDFHSNGFKIRESGNFVNAGGQPFIYMAFAQEPVVANVGTNGLPATAK